MVKVDIWRSLERHLVLKGLDSRVHISVQHDTPVMATAKWMGTTIKRYKLNDYADRLTGITGIGSVNIPRLSEQPIQDTSYEHHNLPPHEDNDNWP
jgi:hypothetical protein